MRILAIETSCDETAAAVIEDGTKIISNVVASSSIFHNKTGGIIPEVAAREQVRCIVPVIKETMKQCGNVTMNSIDALAVTIGPGLNGSLLIGVETAKTISLITGKPIIPVNHIFAHLYANWLYSPLSTTHHPLPTFPAIALVVSGGHTELFLMKNHKDIKWLGGTLDDAAGEAFDKTARLLGFGSKGGAAIQQAAKKSSLIKLPRPLINDQSLNFSFSGLKTAILREWNKRKDPSLVSAFAYEVQEAITDVLVAKTKHAAEKFSAKSILISGGVAANLRLREKLPQAIAPPIHLCTDNAAYIASYAYFRGEPTDWHEVTAIPDLSVEV